VTVADLLQILHDVGRCADIFSCRVGGSTSVCCCRSATVVGLGRTRPGAAFGALLPGGRGRPVGSVGSIGSIGPVDRVGRSGRSIGPVDRVGRSGRCGVTGRGGGVAWIDGGRSTPIEGGRTAGTTRRRDVGASTSVWQIRERIGQRHYQARGESATVNPRASGSGPACCTATTLGRRDGWREQRSATHDGPSQKRRTAITKNAARGHRGSGPPDRSSARRCRPRRAHRPRAAARRAAGPGWRGRRG
jgi:hypothetical protein